MTRNRLQVTAGGLAGIVTIAFTVMLSPLLRFWYRRWGATPAEVERDLPGDDLVRHPRSDQTLAITVRAPTTRVWPWLVQIGCRRAGWYSYDLLDNGGVDSARRILPEHQRLQVGDQVLATPDGRVGYPVAAVEPGTCLVLGGTLNTETGQGADPDDPQLKSFFSGSNAFYLEEAAGSTRLLFRLRLDWSPSATNTLAYRVFLEPISFVMARRMLKGIRGRAESTT